MKNKKKRKLWFLCAGASDGRLPKTKVEGLLVSAASDCKSPGMIQKTKEMIETNQRTPNGTQGKITCG